MGTKLAIDVVREHTETKGLTPTLLRPVVFFRADHGYHHTVILKPSIYVMFNGRNLLRVGDKTINILPGTVLVVASKIIVETDYGGVDRTNPGYGISVRIDINLLRELIFDYEKLNNDPHPVIEEVAFDQIELSNAMSDSLYDLAKAAVDPELVLMMGKHFLRAFYYELVKSPIKHMMYKFGEISERGQEVAKVISFLEENITEKITIDDITKASGLSSSVLHTKFKKMTNYSPMQFLKHLRLHHAKDLLLSGNSASESAFQSGYNNHSQFSREFKRKFGSLPKEIRRVASLY